MSVPLDSVKVGHLDCGDVILHEVSIHADQVTDPSRCPRCKSQDILWEGSFRREFLEEFRAGESQGEDLRPIEKCIVAINCKACQTRFLLESKRLYELRKRIMELEMQVAGGRGVTAVEEKKSRKVN